MATAVHSNWSLGSIAEPWWSGHQDLDYVNEQFNDPASLAHWQALGYTQTRFTGDMYDMRNPEPGWIDLFRSVFPWQHWAWSVYRMGPGTVLPNHSDTYVRYREIYGIQDLGQIWRAVVFLEPWQSGHYFEIDGQPVTQWSRGDFAMWPGTTPHLAANMGQTPRYTLQITGVIE